MGCIYTKQEIYEESMKHHKEALDIYILKKVKIILLKMEVKKRIAIKSYK
jgi:hypothetical protein